MENSNPLPCICFKKKMEKLQGVLGFWSIEKKDNFTGIKKWQEVVSTKNDKSLDGWKSTQKRHKPNNNNCFLSPEEKKNDEEAEFIFCVLNPDNDFIQNL